MGSGEGIYGEGGHLLYKTPTVDMKARATSGVFSALKRTTTGISFLVLELTGSGEVVFVGSTPGKVVQIPLRWGRQSWVNMAHSS